VTEAPGASIPIVRAQSGVVGSETATLRSAVSPVLVTVTENAAVPPLAIVWVFGSLTIVIAGCATITVGGVAGGSFAGGSTVGGVVRRGAGGGRRRVGRGRSR